MTPPTPALTRTSNQEEPDPAQPARPSPGRPAAFLALHPLASAPASALSRGHTGNPFSLCTHHPMFPSPSILVATAFSGLCSRAVPSTPYTMATCCFPCVEPLFAVPAVSLTGGGGALFCSQLHPRCLQQCLGPGRCWVSTYGTNN